MNSYLITGGLITLIGIVISYGYERKTFSPIIIFLCAFFLHAYVDVFIRQGVDFYFNTESLAVLMPFNIMSNILLILGFITYYRITLKKSKRLKEKLYSRPVLSPLGFSSSVAAVLLIFVVAMIVFYISGTFSSGKGAFSYTSRGVLYNLTLAATYSFYSLVPAIFLSVRVDRNTVSKKIALFVCVLVIFLYSSSQLGRQTIMFIILTLVIIQGCRVKNIGLKQISLLLLFLFSLSTLALYRKGGEGILTLDFSSVDMDYATTFEFLGKSLPGQAVFSNTVQLLESQPFFLGKTYFDSLLRIFLPDFMTAQLTSETPAFWYKENFAPLVEGHGFDFSMSAEAYMNFGFFGVIVFFALGIFLGFLTKKIIYTKSPLVVIWSVIITASLVVGLRNDSNALLTRNVFFILPYFFMSYVLLKPKK